MKDSMGNRMKDYEGRTRFFLPRRCYTLIRLDGKTFHTYTKGLDRPFDEGLKSDMQETTKLLCKNIQGAKVGYTQSDEITILLTDFDNINTSAWFDGNLQKIVSVSASMTTSYFNFLRYKRTNTNKIAFFDSRAWTLSDPWEVYNTFLWRQKDCTKNSIQMAARSLYSPKELMNKNYNELNEMIFQKGKNFNDYDTDSKRGTFVYKKENDWFIDKEMPILSQDKIYFFDKIPMIPQVKIKDIIQ
jgi:tRNA(His) 5'-end guanylyltransferase